MFDLTQLAAVADIPRLQARVRPESPALLFEDDTITYAALDRHASRVGNGLRTAGLAPQDRIAFLGKNSAAYFELLLGALKARVVMVGVNWRLALPEIAYILNDASCRALFVGREYYPLVDQLRAQCPGLDLVVAMDGQHAIWPAYVDWRAAQPPSDLFGAPDPDDDVIQLYTSGTTGHPKGVQLTNANYLACLRAAQAAQWADCAPGDVNLACMPVFHVAGVNMGLIALAQGCTCVVMREVNVEAILDLIPRHRVNHMFLVPAVIVFLVQHPRSRVTDFSSLRRLYYGASPIAEEVLREAQTVFGCEFYQLYGLTETVGAGACLPAAAHVAGGGKLRSCGVPYPGIEMGVVDAAGRALGPGAVGEIVIRSEVVMKGYWNNPDATAQSIRDGWFHTGDAGYFDAEGFLYIHDRVKDMIVSGGENVYPAEVENALFGHPAVADVAVIGVPDERWGEAVKAIVVLKPGSTATAADIITHVRSRIAGFKVPKSIDFVAALPRNPSGKILRRELREPYWRDRERRVN